MPTSRYQDKVLETYARSLLEAAKAENHVFEDLEMIERLASASPEIIAVLDSMSKRDQLDLLPKVAAAFKYVARGRRGCSGRDPSPRRSRSTTSCVKPSLRNASRTSAARYSLSSRLTRLSWAAWCSRPAASVVTFPSRRSCASRRRPSQTLLIRTEVKPNVRNPQCPGYRQETAGAAHEPLRDGRYA